MVQRKRRTALNKKSKADLSFIKPALLVTISISLIYIIFATDLISFDGAGKSTEHIAADSAVTEKPVTVNQVNVTPEKVSVRKVQIEILNGCGVSNITDSFRPFFKEQNIDVISTGNYKDFDQLESFIIVSSESYYQLALDIAKELRINEEMVKKDYNDQPLNELTLVLGKDYGLLNK